MTTTTTTTPATAEPLLCPLCDYNLTGLTEPRCPECGHTFEWAELTDPARQRVPWLFEHRRFLGGFSSTQVRMLVFWRFWRTLRPAHAIKISRLAIFLALGYLAPLVAVASVMIGSLFYFTHQSHKEAQAAWLKSPVPVQVLTEFPLNSPLPPIATYADYYSRREGITRQEWLDQQAPLFGRPGFVKFAFDRFHGGGWRAARATITVFLAPPASALLVLFIMQETFAKRRILKRHSLRVVAYAIDLLPAALAVLAFAAWLIYRMVRHTIPSGPELAIAMLTLAILIHLLWLLRLEAAVRLYLGVRRAWSVALAWFVINGLSVVILLIIFAG